MWKNNVFFPRRPCQNSEGHTFNPGSSGGASLVFQTCFVHVSMQALRGYGWPKARSRTFEDVGRRNGNVWQQWIFIVTLLKLPLEVLGAKGTNPQIGYGEVAKHQCCGFGEGLFQSGFLYPTQFECLQSRPDSTETLDESSEIVWFCEALELCWRNLHPCRAPWINATFPRVKEAIPQLNCRFSMIFRMFCCHCTDLDDLNAQVMSTRVVYQSLCTMALVCRTRRTQMLSSASDFLRFQWRVNSTQILSGFSHFEPVGSIPEWVEDWQNVTSCAVLPQGFWFRWTISARTAENRGSRRL